MGILLVYDVTDESSFNNIRNWIRNIEQHASDNVNKILVGNKADMDESKRDCGKQKIRDINFGHKLMMRDTSYSKISGSRIKLGELEYVPPRNGATIWEIGIPDRTAAEFYVPQPNPMLLNQLYVQNSAQGFRQYGLWDRYTDEYPDQDLVYTVGVSNHQIDWFFAHVNRNIGNKTYVPTTWQILFDPEEIDESENYTLHLALASATAYLCVHTCVVCANCLSNARSS
ncbi:hypothetical protein POM88_021539 [Heracleum sosnowskyi]|uniref:Rhamnogalacturonan lyase domain-containing protein n=1 Tax=Heracleum sosnowskyi TaxID=360622 RepID=A0AAD8IF14_9APIA|nr:hypothetical protein POM88_021539 [Heracleum sosnowskyi]